MSVNNCSNFNNGTSTLNSVVTPLSPVQLPQYLTVTGSGTISANESGCVFMLTTSAAGDITMNLPAPQIGLNYKFIVHAVANAHNVVITATGALVNGYLMGAATIVLCTAKTSVTIVQADALLGDSITYQSDGISWFVQGYAQVAGSFTVA